MMPELRPEAQALLEKVTDFIKVEVMPKENIFHEQIKVGEDRWNSYHEVIAVSYKHLTLPTIITV